MFLSEMCLHIRLHLYYFFHGNPLNISLCKVNSLFHFFLHTKLSKTTCSNFSPRAVTPGAHLSSSSSSCLVVSLSRCMSASTFRCSPSTWRSCSRNADSSARNWKCGQHLYNSWLLILCHASMSLTSPQVSSGWQNALSPLTTDATVYATPLPPHATVNVLGNIVHRIFVNIIFITHDYEYVAMHQSALHFVGNLVINLIHVLCWHFSKFVQSLKMLCLYLLGHNCLHLTF